MINHDNRINCISYIVSKILNIDILKAKDYVLESNIGKAILDNNEVVLYDQSTANAYDIFKELKMKDIICELPDCEDITKYYLEYLRLNQRR